MSRKFIGIDGGAYTQWTDIPIVCDADHVKATTTNTSYYPYHAMNVLNDEIGLMGSAQWVAGASQATNQRFNIDLGSAKLFNRIKYHNSHHAGANTNIGVQNFTAYGSNDVNSFSETAYATDTGWTQIGGSMSFDEHMASNVPDPKFILVAGSTSYRYISLKFANNWGYTYMGIRRIVLQSASIVTYDIAHTIKNIKTLKNVKEIYA